MNNLLHWKKTFLIQRKQGHSLWEDLLNKHTFQPKIS